MFTLFVYPAVPLANCLPRLLIRFHVQRLNYGIVWMLNDDFPPHVHFQRERERDRVELHHWGYNNVYDNIKTNNFEMMVGFYLMYIYIFMYVYIHIYTYTVYCIWSVIQSQSPISIKDAERTPRTIIWYKRTCIRNQRDNFLSPSKPLKSDVNKIVVIERVVKYYVRIYMYIRTCIYVCRVHIDIFILIYTWTHWFTHEQIHNHMYILRETERERCTWRKRPEKNFERKH